MTRQTEIRTLSINSPLSPYGQLVTTLLKRCAVLLLSTFAFQPDVGADNGSITVFKKPMRAEIINPGMVAVDALARQRELSEANALNLCIGPETIDPEHLKILHVNKASDGYGTDERFWYWNANFRLSGANCLAGNKAACDTVQKYALDWAKTSKIKNPRRNGSARFWNETLGMNLWLLTPMISALSVAEQLSPLPHQDREIVDKWIKEKVDGSENGMRHKGNYKGGRDGTHARKAAHNHAIVSSMTAMSYGAWTNNRKYFQTGLDQWFITLRSMRRDGSLPIETRRGARALFYTGNALSSLIGIAERASVQGINLYEAAPNGNKTIHSAVKFVLDAIDDPKLILRYAKKNRHPGPDKNYKIQNFVWLPSAMAWIPAYANRFPTHPNTQRLLARKHTEHSQPRNYLTEQFDYAIRTNGRQDGYKAGEWVGVDVECFYAQP